MTYGDKFTPTDLATADGDRVRIAWADGAESLLPMDYLRSKCPCAGCIEEWTGVVKVRYEDVVGVTVKKMGQVGNYAFSITFSDGHATGIFTYKRLRELGDLQASEGSGA